ncbi:DNA/RNA helicase, DEAD/DEAH box type [Cordyceps militaris CM01]|uniref:ATP-dependent RNA helicase n=1 Tax=Cordyceps militaris (strain CM01) TaxID=983644 RepID=G3JJC6_CORMM|nr:DNA/RNA helicase, DEAD/DEAH box type [Cordyceps militaris CM01]EGX91220.1 DNA/RNA helicase, DEAD/DEAH box type [Cordyceps militaris CM01]
MADDGMLLNFDFGSVPIKPLVKFKGGRWRDRKQAERGARPPGADGSPPARRPPRDPRERFDDSNRPFKRRRADAGDEPAANHQPNTRPSHIKIEHGGLRPPFDSRRNGPGSGNKGTKQVVSSLFSFNPEQKTVFEDEEWSAPTPTNAPLADVANFGTLTLSSRLVEELSKMSLERPTAIQQKVIPHMITGSADAFVQAETGSGKTFSYLLPILHRVLQLSAQNDGKQVHRDSGLFAIIVAPTRELAKQTHTVLEQLIRPFPWLVSTAITGGESKKAEKARIRKGVNFLVATPGRLADHIDNTQALSLETVRWLILDEGDRLMDLGFEDDLQKTIDALRDVEIAKETSNGTSLATLPDRRVSILCSATMKMNVQKLGEMSLADAVFLSADKGEMTADENIEHKAPAQLHQSHVIVPAKLRLVTLACYLKSIFSRKGHTMKVIVFMSCADAVDFHYELLRNPNDTEAPPAQPNDLESVSKTVARAAYLTSQASPEVILHRMHGSLTQSVRSATLRTFSACKLPSVLITTDVSSRGLDIPSVDLVIEYDPAFSFADHIHRIGRTARAGRAGEAMLFLLPGCEEGYVELLRASGTPTAHSYEAILQKGLMSKLEFPVQTSAKLTEGQTYHEKAETMQLHLEQRLLEDPRRLELARNGFKSHIRAYATHTKEERGHFNMAELHLGHTAKSYALREPPRGVGSGIDRKVRKGGKKGHAPGPKNDDQEQPVNEGAARSLLRKKGMMLMTGADEFNIG